MKRNPVYVVVFIILFQWNEFIKFKLDKPLNFDALLFLKQNRQFKHVLMHWEKIQ